MKILQINIFGNLSTGRIAVDLYRILKSAGHEGIVAFARNEIERDVPHIIIGNKWSIYADGIMTRLTGRAGFFSKRATNQLIQKIETYKPDIVHLHNLHGYYINIELLFNYLRSSGIPTVWTLHDCWAFTGHCAHYVDVNCGKWKTGCYDCPLHHTYPASFVDNSRWNYQKKKLLFTSVENVHLVTVSKWLKAQVTESYLGELDCDVIYNGIDLDVFRPTESDIRNKYGIGSKFMILGVASTWNRLKGLEDFIQLAKELNEDYQIVLVGVSERDKEQLPANIIGIQRTNNTRELAEIYTASDVFVNPSKGETFGLTTVEAMACGTPVIVYDNTAIPETVTPSCGFVVPTGDIQELKEQIIAMRECGKDYSTACIAQAACFSRTDNYLKYIELYEALLRDNR